MADLVEEKQHARLSPSASKRWMTCAGSVGMIEKLNIQDKPSRFAAEGTVAHEVHELCLVKNQEAKEYLGKTIEADGFKFKVNQDMVDAVQLSLDYINDRIQKAQMDGIEVQVLVEVRASLKHLGIPGLDGGTSDVVLIFSDDDGICAIEIFDYKHGAGVAVDAIHNTQAMCYAVGVCNEYQVSTDTPVYITISQPRAHHPDGRIRTWETNAVNLKNWEDSELIPKARATFDEATYYRSFNVDDIPDDWIEPTFVPSEDGCRWCAVGHCPMLFERTQEVAMLDFADDKEVNLPDVEVLTSKQKQFIMDNAGVLRIFITGIENQVRNEIDQGSQEYEGHYKLVRKKTNRKFTEDALDELCSPLLDHLEHSDIYQEKPRTMTEIEKRLKKAIGPKDAKEIMDEITTKPEGDLVIAPESDKRKGVPPALIGDFKDI